MGHDSTRAPSPPRQHTNARLGNPGLVGSDSWLMEGGPDLSPGSGPERKEKTPMLRSREDHEKVAPVSCRHSGGRPRRHPGLPRGRGPVPDPFEIGESPAP